MSKHELPATDLDDERIVWIQPDPDPKADPGWRLKLDKPRGEMAFLVEERVLPERVDNPNAHRILCDRAKMFLTRANAEWLRDSLIEMLELGDEW